MEAPDKIYLHEISAKELTENLPYHICYIRKDALLEWLNKAITATNNNGIRAGFNIVLTKIESL